MKEILLYDLIEELRKIYDYEDYITKETLNKLFDEIHELEKLKKNLNK